MNKDYRNKQTLGQLYNKHSIRKIAEQFAVSHNAIWKTIKKLGIERPIRKKADKRRERIDALKREEAKRKKELHNLYWKKGLTVEGIAKLRGVHPQTVRRWLIKLEIPMKKAGSYKTIKREKMKKQEIKARYRDKKLPAKVIKDIKKRVGLSNAEIALLTNISFVEIYNIESGKHSPHLLTRKKLFKLYRKILKRLGESSSKLYV